MGREGETGRETSVCGCLSRSPSWGPSPQPRHVPWPRIQQRSFGLQAGWHSIHWATLARAIYSFSRFISFFFPCIIGLYRTSGTMVKRTDKIFKPCIHWHCINMILLNSSSFFSFFYLLLGEEAFLRAWPPGVSTESPGLYQGPFTRLNSTLFLALQNYYNLFSAL